MLLPTEKNKSFRIALLGIYHESNTFIPNTTTIEDFRNSRWLKGSAIIDEYKNAYHELGGAIEVFTNNDVELFPVFYAETTPGGIITENTYLTLAETMLHELDKVLPVDACFVVPHGAAVAENYRDMDGSWLSMLRNKIGNEIPVVGTLDAHANVSQLMIDSTNGLFPYQTNPHIDQRETGRRAADFLLSLLKKEIDPVQELLQVPLSISIEQQHTSAEPCKSLYQFAHELGQTENVLHVNITIGFPYADVHEMGTSAIIITDHDQQKADSIKCNLLKYFIQHKEKFVGVKEDIDTQIKKILKNSMPALLLDMGDNVGGGSNGDSTFLLEKLENSTLKSFICIYDKEAVAEVLTHKLHETFPLSFGNNPDTGKRFSTTVTLKGLHDGVFKEEEPRHGGQVNYDMGTTAIVVTEKGTTVMLNAKRIPPFSLSQLTSCNVHPGSFEVIVAKGVNAPLSAYGPVCPTVIQANTPGVTQADMVKFNYEFRRKPLYPFEN